MAAPPLSIQPASEDEFEEVKQPGHKSAVIISGYASAENLKIKPEDLMYQWKLFLPFTEGAEEAINASVSAEESPHSYVCRHCLPRWLTNSSNGSVFKHNAAGINIQSLPCLRKAFSRCLNMGWLIIKTGVIQARVSVERKKAAVFPKGDRSDNILFLLENRDTSSGWHQGVWSGCGIM